MLCVHEASSIDVSPLFTRTFEAVLFDNDGTLVSSIAAVEAAWLAWAGEYGVEPAKLSDLHGKPAAVTVAALVGQELFDEAYARIRQLELASTIPAVALPGAVDAVTATMGRNAIVTSADAALFSFRAREAGIPTPTVTVTFDDVSRGKPDPEPYVHAAELLGADPKRCLVVEDAPAGVASGRAAGASVLGIAAGAEGSAFAPGHALLADVIVPNLAAVRFVLVDGGVRVEAAS